MNWDDVRIFLAVARTGQILAASKRLGVNHATLSRRLTALEEALGTRLFVRRTNGCEPTAEGEIFLASAERMETEMLAAQARLGRTDTAIAGTVRIGAPDGFGVSFLAPPDANKINAWWHWMDGYITKSGITRDLEAMHAEGIHSATILNIARLKNLEGNPEVKFGSAEWYEMFRYAIKEAKRLGMTIGTSNCDGWSESGGPWIKPENSMKQYTWRKTFINGGRQVAVKLNEPVGFEHFYKDDRVLAYRSAGANSFETARPSTKLDGKAIGDTLTDGSPVSLVECKAGTQIDLTFKKAFTAEKMEIITNRIRSSAARDIAHFSLLAGSSDQRKCQKPRSKASAGETTKASGPFHGVSSSR